jgi:enoyl-CoA hydratase
MAHQTILYSNDGAIATISLNRPERLNTIVPPMPEEIAAAVDTPNLNDDIPDALFITCLLHQQI